MLPLQTEEVLSPRNPRRHHATGWVLRRCGAGVWVPWCWDIEVHRPYATSTSEHSVSIGIGAAHRRPGRGYMFGV